MKISDIDFNFKKTSLNEKNIKFCDVKNKPFTLYGIMPPDSEENRYRRMPGNIANSVNPGTAYLYTNTAGGRVRFKTNSPYIAIKAVYPDICVMGHMPQCGISGFSVYYDENGKQFFRGTFIPNGKKNYEGIVYFPDKKMRNITVYFPLYNNLTSLSVGLDADSEIDYADGYKIKSPVVFYGSSITQGGCASRPGNDYEARLSRVFDCDYLNLGFSGNAKGELEMARYIGTLDMSVFVMDYDHNAPDAGHLRKTHEPFFREFRKSKPDTPVIFVSRPQLVPDNEKDKRFEIIKKTYENAVMSGDGNVYLVDGGMFFEEMRFNDATVDGCHPNDLGFYYMAKGIEPVLKKIMKI